MTSKTESGRNRITLYVSGDGSNSTIAIDNLRMICRRQLGREQAFELVDINEQRDRAVADDVVYTPLLVIRRGEKETRYLGNLNKNADVIRAISSLGGLDG